MGGSKQGNMKMSPAGQGNMNMNQQMQPAGTPMGGMGGVGASRSAMLSGLSRGVGGVSQLGGGQQQLGPRPPGAMNQPQARMGGFAGSGMRQPGPSEMRGVRQAVGRGGSQGQQMMGNSPLVQKMLAQLSSSGGMGGSGTAMSPGGGAAGMRHGGAVRPGRLVGSRASGRGFQAGGIADAMGGMAPGMVPPGMEEIGGMVPGMGEMGGMAPGMEEEFAVEEQAMEVPIPETSGEMAQQQEMLNIVLEAKAALEGDHPNPEEAIMKFIEVFGEEELESLKVAVIEEMQSGEASDGMSDSLPANIDGQEEIAVSEGEYIVPSDAVSGLGNGDTNSGAQRLGDMVDKIRVARNGAPVQPPEMMAEEVMPI